MYKNNEELNKILDELLLNPENECVEFKKAENNFDIDTLGKYFSALGNEANLKNAMAMLALDYTPLSDMRASSDYRMKAAQNLLRRFWLETRSDAPMAANALNAFASA